MNTENSHDLRQRDIRVTTIVGAVINLILSILKIVFGWIGHSQSLVADGIHSLSDLLSDALVLFASTHGSKGADENHPYGHGRIETLATVILGGFLILVGVGIGTDAAYRLFQPEQLMHPGALALSIAVLSVVLKEGLYHYTLFYARKHRSNLLRANAWHHRTDSISSVVVIVGIVGTMAGLPYLDAIAAVAVGLMIIKIGWELGWSSLQELVDTALDPERVENIRKSIMTVDGVRDLHMLRSRLMGHEAIIDVHIIVDSKLSVSEGHQIGEIVRHKLIKEFDEINDITVHIDPEDDLEVSPSSHLPKRRLVIDELKKHWKELVTDEDLEEVTLHYLDGKVHVELLLSLSRLKEISEARMLSDSLKERVQMLDYLGEVHIKYY